MGSTTSSNLPHRNVIVTGQQVRFLDRDPVPVSLRGKEVKLEQEAHRVAVVRVGGRRMHVPKDWLVPAQGSTTSDQPTSHPSLAQSTGSEGDDDLITEQVWYGILDACLELNLSQEDAYQVIAEAIDMQPDELDPSRLTWRQYLQIIERLEQLDSTS
jgi:hypothetical protein